MIFAYKYQKNTRDMQPEHATHNVTQQMIWNIK